MKAIETLFCKHLDDDGKFVGGKIAVNLSVRGTDENGITYHAWHQYSMKDILIGYRHVPLQRHSYVSENFYREAYLCDNEKRNINASEDFYQSGKRIFPLSTL